MSGYVGANYEVAGQFNPPLMPAGNEDPGNGLLGAVGILMALLHRQRTGTAQYVETPQLNAAMVHVAHIVRRCADGSVLNAERLDTMQMGTSALSRLYETADGWICLVASSSAEISALGAAIDVDLLADERFHTRAARAEHDYELADVVGTPLLARTTEEALAALRAAGVPAAVPVPRNDATFLTDPENLRTARVAECPHPRRGHVRELAVLVRVSGSTPPPHRLAPSLGEHTEEILRMLGHDQETIGKLKTRGVAR
jgi:crotonobetainyl-CoA:carnitine CoA-transferase CaiB-like acyl-CoA transferase